MQTPDPCYLMGGAAGIEAGQAVETLVVLGEAAEAEVEGSNAALGQEGALFLQVCGEALGKLAGAEGLGWSLGVALGEGGSGGFGRPLGRGLLLRSTAGVRALQEVFWLP